MLSSAELVFRVKGLSEKLASLAPVLKLDLKKKELEELSGQMSDPEVWQDQDRASGLAKKQKHLEDFVGFWEKLAKDTGELLEMVKQNQDESEETMAFLQTSLEGLETAFEKKRALTLMSGKYDQGDAIFAIHAGAGGTDAQDWAEMLLRMYSRFCESKGLEVEVMELSRGGEAGVKSVLFEVHGSQAYGFLRGEAGVHRLVRLSPFNPAHTRETSFALVEVLPVIAQPTFKLEEKDLKIEANTSSGHGGQSVNTTYSAIRITHIPTGIRVSIQNERSQHQNKEVALKILSARLEALEEERLAKEKKELRGEFKSAEWGNQIRSYVLHPYQMVKDHRTGAETSDTEGILDGKLDEFVEKYLEWQVSKKI